MSATTVTREPRRIRRQEGAASQAPTDTRRLWGKARTVLVRLRERIDSVRFPAYVSAFEAEQLYALARWSDCRTGTLPQPIIEQRYGGE